MLRNTKTFMTKTFEFFHDIKRGGSEVKGLLISKCAQDI